MICGHGTTNDHCLHCLHCKVYALAERWVVDQVSKGRTADEITLGVGVWYDRVKVEILVERRTLAETTRHVAHQEPAKVRRL